MPPENSVFTDNTTFINPLGLIFTLLMGVLVVAAPRRHVYVPILATVCYMTLGMRLMVFGLNFTMIRVLLVFCWARLFLKHEFRVIQFNGIDKAVIWFVVVSIVTHSLLLGSDGFKYKVGQAYDALGFYFFFRIVGVGLADVYQIVKVLCYLLIPLSIEMVAEKLTGTNAFAIFGGVDAAVIVRNGTLRAQGPFGHPILAGTFGATVMPLLAAWWLNKKSRPMAIFGLTAATLITITAGSSGPIMAYAAAALFLVLYRFRQRMASIRRLVLLALVSLHLGMKAPVWFLLARVSVFEASTGMHRAVLIDQCVNHFSEWWMYGTTNYGNWGYYLFDRTNHFVCLATDGGIATLLLFVVILVLCFRSVGVVVRNSDQSWAKSDSIFAWALGVALATHCVGFISVTYFDQNMINWYLLLALIASSLEFKPTPADENCGEEARPFPATGHGVVASCVG